MSNSNSLTAIIFFLCASSAQAQSVLIPNESYAELQKFQSDGQGLSEKFVREFPLRVHEEILRTEAAFLKTLNNNCRDSVKITFGAKVLDNKTTAEAVFEKGLIKVEASKCFPNANPSDLIEISGDPGFKRRAFSTIRNITSEATPLGVKDCEWTSAPTIGKSHYCYLNTELEKNSDLHSQANFLVYNDASTEAPVYFREAVTTARRMGPQTLYYVHSYVRATAFSSIKKLFVEQAIESSQNQVFEELAKALNNKRVK